MPLFDPIQTAFNSGELSPHVYGRPDTKKYAHGVKTMVNWLPLPQGPVRRRGGWRYVAATKDQPAGSTLPYVRLLPFEFNTAQTFALEFGDQILRFYTNGGQVQVSGVPYEIATPYSAADLPYLSVAQSGDIMYIAHPDYPIHKLTRLGTTNWTLVEATIENGPFLDLNTDSTSTITVDYGATYPIKLTAVNDLWEANHVGAYWYLREASGAAGYIRIDQFIDSKTVEGTIMNTWSPTLPFTTDEWAEGAWSEVQGYPYAVTFFQERLFAGGTDGQPDTVWGSVTGNFEDFAAGTTASDAVIYSILSEKVNVIQWMTSRRDAIIVGTGSGIYSLSGGGIGNPLTPDNALALRESVFGADVAAPATAGSEVQYITRSRRQVRSVQYSQDRDALDSMDLTFVASHLGEDSLFSELISAPEPLTYLWAKRISAAGDVGGSCCGLVYEPLEKVLGWYRVESETDAGESKLVSITAIAGSSGTDIWAVWARELASGWVMYVELLDDTIFLDSGITYSGPPTTTLSGADHLEGETVGVLVDGAVHPDVVVSGGKVTLEFEGSEVVLGKRFRSTLKLLPQEQGNPAGTSQVAKRSWARVYLRLYNSHLLEVNGRLPPTRQGEETMDEPPPLFSGDMEVATSGWHPGEELTITTDDPLPAEVVAIFGTQEIGVR